MRRLADTTTGGYFSANSARYADLVVSRPEFQERYTLFGSLIDEHAPSRRGTAKCVDLGCGTGVLGRYAAGLGYETLGIDESEAMISAAEGHTPENVASRIRYRRQRLPLSEAELESLGHAFDLAILSSVAEYVEDDLGLLGQCGEMLCSGRRVDCQLP